MNSGFKIIQAGGMVLLNLIGPDGYLRLLPASVYAEMQPEAIQLLGHKHARYGFPTTELVAWLKDEIGDRKAIEIGSGAGDLAHYLGITATDNRMQEQPSIVAHYRLLGQPTITYGKHVQKLDALEAIQQLKPEVVIAQWVTHKYDERESHRAGNMFGVDEDALLDTGVTYIVIGNEAVHKQKRILERPHETYAFPWLVSRANDPSLNRIWVWRGRYSYGQRNGIRSRISPRG